MNCAQVRFAIDDREKDEEIGRHLAECPSCVEFKHRLGKAWAALDGLAVEEPSPFAVGRLMARLKKRAGIQRVYYALAAAVLLVSFGAQWLLSLGAFSQAQAQYSPDEEISGFTNPALGVIRTPFAVAVNYEEPR